MRKVRLFLALGGGLAFSMASAAPQQFSAYIGGFLGDSFVVEWNGKNLVYSTRKPDQGVIVKASIQPTEAQWRTFKTALEKAGVQHWKGNYQNPHVLEVIRKLYGAGG